MPVNVTVEVSYLKLFGKNKKSNYSYHLKVNQLNHFYLPGPLTYEDAGKTYLIGVVSWGKGCADPKYPGVYARVTKVLDWIQEQFKQ